MVQRLTASATEKLKAALGTCPFSIAEALQLLVQWNPSAAQDEDDTAVGAAASGVANAKLSGQMAWQGRSHEAPTGAVSRLLPFSSA